MTRPPRFARQMLSCPARTSALGMRQLAAKAKRVQMRITTTFTAISLLAGMTIVSGCSGRMSGDAAAPRVTDERILRQRASTPLAQPERERERETIWDLFRNADDPNTTVEVNKYIWTAAQQVLDFMPVETVDPFSGVIVYGYGVPPGGGQAYRATVYVQDPSLDARALNVALATRAGPASPDTIREIENAILTRARQLRARDADF